MVNNESKTPSFDIYRKNISLMKINNTHAIHLYIIAIFIHGIFIFYTCHSGSFPVN